ncbi:amidohydrolase family protein [Rhodoligotrophos defluvii]|uniref:amidohydrolase family protein n=1 Tax=Rhodoligotrophos defluvii TaxID=2561934 RepID=UPI0010C93CD2|nr:amidohydrolase family protein [Rhodoligotrophos defluvii]
MEPQNRGRRKLLAGAGAAALVTGIPARAASGATNTSGALEVIDFHSHFVGSAFTSNAGAAAPAAQKARWQQVNRNLSDVQALLSSIETAGVAARVVSTPLEFIRGADGEIPPDAERRANDQLAELVGRNPGRLYGLATVDAYNGDAGAQELTRAVRELGLRGVFLEAAKKDLLLDAPEARPTLTAAATLGVPVFVHPISDPQLSRRLARYGRLGTTLNRGTINSAALVALIESGTFDELPGLRIVVTTLAIGTVLLAGGFGDGLGLRSDTPELSRRHVYIDTMGLSPVLIRSAVDLLGADHVLAGTDWPIFVERSVPERLQAAMAFSGLNPVEQQWIAGANAQKLLGIA